jgi:acetyl-CoA synthetase
VAHPAVAEAAAVGVPDELKGETLVVVCVLRAGQVPNERLASEVSAAVVQELGKTLRPARVIFAPELPKTRNAKVMRRVVRGVCAGRDELGDLSGLENPGAVETLRAALRCR